MLTAITRVFFPGDSVHKKAASFSASSSNSSMLRRSGGASSDELLHHSLSDPTFLNEAQVLFVTASVTFLQAVQDWRNAATVDTQSRLCGDLVQARCIFRTYVAVGAQKEVNISYQLRKSLRIALESADRHRHCDVEVFAEAETKVRMSLLHGQA